MMMMLTVINIYREYEKVARFGSGTKESRVSPPLPGGTSAISHAS